MSGNVTIIIITAAAGLALGCASTNGSYGSPSPFDQQHTNAKSSSLRQAVLNEQGDRLVSLQTESARLESWLSSASPKLTEEDRLFLRNRLRTLRQKEEQTEADLERARTATPAEWADLQTTIMAETDGMERDALSISNSIQLAVSSALPPAPSKPPQNQLCSLAVPDEKTVVKNAKDHVEVLLSSKNNTSVATLRQVADIVARNYEYRITTEPHSAGTMTVPVRISAENIHGGVKLKISPAQASHLSTLEGAIERDAQELNSGGC